MLNGGSFVCDNCGKLFAAARHKDRTHRLCSQPCWWELRKTLPRRAVPTRIRRLRDDEPVPGGRPKRCMARGYVVLRWKVGVRSYVELLEHRYIAGRHMPHVHHKNRVKTDNDPANLKPVSILDHGAEHARSNLHEAAALYASGWSLPRLARRYGVHSVTVMRGLKKRGVKMRTLTESWVIRKAIRVKD